MKKNRFLLEPREKLLICVECGKGRKKCKCEESIRCPYCQSQFEESGDLSIHIDNIHIGKGLLEGNFSGF